APSGVARPARSTQPGFPADLRDGGWPGACQAASTMHELIAPVLAHLERASPGDLVGAYLYGSAVSSGLRPDSDVDLLLVTQRSLTAAERADLTAVLLASSAGGTKDRNREGGRAIEL